MRRMKHYETSPIPYSRLQWAMLKAIFKVIQRAVAHYCIEYTYYYSRRLYFRFLSPCMRNGIMRFLPQKTSSITLRGETDKWIIIYLIKYGKYSSDDIAESLVYLNVSRITRRVVENTFREHRGEFENLPDTYLSQFSARM